MPNLGAVDREDPWTLVRMDIRSTATPDRWPVARVELRHATRGRLTDIASCEGHLDGVFKAIAGILGLEGEVHSLDIDYSAADIGRSVHAAILVEVAGRSYRGEGGSGDVLRSCAMAYLQALSRAERGG